MENEWQYSESECHSRTENSSLENGREKKLKSLEETSEKSSHKKNRKRAQL